MSTLSLLPRSVTDLNTSIEQCHRADHAHKSPNIEVVTCKIGGVPVWIETEQNSGRFNVKFGDEADVNLTERAARSWLAGKMKP